MQHSAPVDPSTLVGSAEVAEMLRQDIRRVTSYASRGYLPTPVAHLRQGRIWTQDQIRAWAAARGLTVRDLAPRRPAGRLRRADRADHA